MKCFQCAINADVLQDKLVLTKVPTNKGMERREIRRRVFDSLRIDVKSVSFESVSPEKTCRYSPEREAQIAQKGQWMCTMNERYPCEQAKTETAIASIL